MELKDETQLVVRLLSGDGCALEQFAATYRRFVTAVLRRQVDLYSDDVEELYQRFLLHIWEDGYRRLRPWRGTRSLRSYLGAMVRNLARDYRRERRRFFDNSALCLAMDVRAECCNDRGSDRSRVVQSAMLELSERDRDLIRRRYFMEESYREIADGLGMTVNHVGVALLRAESRLKVVLKKYGDHL